MRASIGLIGYGRFGRLAARYASRSAEVFVHDPRARVRTGRGVHSATLGKAASLPVVVLAVPIGALRNLLRQIRPHLRPDALVIDVCSVKTVPLAWMNALLPGSVSIIGMHPLFGPDSDTGSLSGQRIVVCPSRNGARRMGALRSLARSHGIRLHVMTPRAHDRLMAETLLLTQYVGRLIRGAGLAPHAWSTPAYWSLKGIVATALRDSEELFVDMVRFNPLGARTLKALLRSHRLIERKTRGAD